MIPYVTNAEFLQRYDWRWVGKNVRDDGTAANEAELKANGSIGGAVLYACLQEASEYVLAAASVGARYSDQDIRIVPNVYEGGGSLLIRIVCDLAMGLVLKRRGRAVSDFKVLAVSYAESMGYIEQLRRGERIFFNVANVPEAGLPAVASMNPIPGIDPPLLTQQALRYFGYPIGGPNPNNWPM